MPKVRSIIQLSGTLGAVTYYRRNGRHFARHKSSLTPERVRTDAAFAASRVTASEYGGAAQISASLRKGLGPLQHLFSRGSAHTRITRAVRTGIRHTPGARTPAPFCVAQAVAALQSTLLTASATLPTALPEGPALQLKSTRAGRILTLTPPEAAAYAAHAPAGATHATPILLILAVPDYEWDTQAKAYRPATHIPAHQRHAPIILPRVPLHSSAPTSGTPIQVQLGKATPGITHLVWSGVLYTQQVGQEHYPILTGSHLRCQTHIPVTDPATPRTAHPHANADTSPHHHLLQLFGITSLTPPT